MSFEYAIEFACEMRRQYGEATLRALARTGSLISTMVNETIEGSHTPSEEGIRFATKFADDLEKVEEAASYCRENCPAHIEQNTSNQVWRQALLERGSEPIGCIGRIRYPVEARFERFLADRLQLLYDTTGPESWPQLLHILIDSESPFDGEGSKELRRVTTEDGLRFFELRLPISLTRRAGRLTTDNVFDLLAGFSASDGGASGYQRELPVMALGDYAEFLEAILINDLTEVERERLLSHGNTYPQFIRFAFAVRLAEQLKVRLLMD